MHYVTFTLSILSGLGWAGLACYNGVVMEQDFSDI